VDALPRLGMRCMLVDRCTSGFEAPKPSSLTKEAPAKLLDFDFRGWGLIRLTLACRGQGRGANDAPERSLPPSAFRFSRSLGTVWRGPPRRIFENLRPSPSAPNRPRAFANTRGFP
jgi:hypothetical protein